jgi:hypothetical protein
MQSIDLIRDNLKRSEEIVLSRVENMRDHCMVFRRSARRLSHTVGAWTPRVHRTLVICEFMLGEANPMAHWEEIVRRS